MFLMVGCGTWLDFWNEESFYEDEVDMAERGSMILRGLNGECGEENKLSFLIKIMSLVGEGSHNKSCEDTDGLHDGVHCVY